MIRLIFNQSSPHFAPPPPAPVSLPKCTPKRAKKASKMGPQNSSQNDPKIDPRMRIPILLGSNPARDATPPNTVENQRSPKFGSGKYDVPDELGRPAGPGWRPEILENRENPEFQKFQKIREMKISGVQKSRMAPLSRSGSIASSDDDFTPTNLAG